MYMYRHQCKYMHYMRMQIYMYIFMRVGTVGPVPDPTKRFQIRILGYTASHRSYIRIMGYTASQEAIQSTNDRYPDHGLHCLS